jgi:hypothetical protein
MEFPYAPWLNVWNMHTNIKNPKIAQFCRFSHMEFPVGAGLFGDFGGCHSHDELVFSMVNHGEAW